MSMSALILILVIVTMVAIMVLYVTGNKFESVTLAIIFAIYLIYIIMTLL